MLWPSDNAWGIPTLDPSMQAWPVPDPVCAWGHRGRTATMSGTWVFYVDDYRFSSLLKHPRRLLATRCAAAVEPNISVFDDSPPAWMLWATYQKRHCAREWQHAGVSVLVDLNVPERYLELAMLGVPRDWRAFATRGYAERPEAVEREHAAARRHHPDAGLLVYGGGARIARLTWQLPGAVWVAGHSHSACMS